MSRNYLLTFATEFLVMLSGIYVYRLAAGFGGDDFGIYAVCRRLVSFLQPALLLGMAVALPKFIAALDPENRKSALSMLKAGAIIPLSLALLLVTISFLLPEKLSFLLLGSEQYAGEAHALTVMVTGLVLHTLVYSYFRGMLDAFIANLLQLLSMAVWPVVCFQLFGSIGEVLFYTGIGWMVFPLILLLTGKSFYAQRQAGWKSHFKKLYTFGIPRVPGDIVFGLFFALPPLIMTHTVSIEEAGYAAFGITLLNMVTAGLSPVSILLLPEVSSWISDKRFDLLFTRIRKLQWVILPLTLAATAAYFVAGSYFMNLFLGEQDPDLVILTGITFSGSAGLALFIGMRSVIDAWYTKPVNTVNILISFAVFAVVSVLFLYFGFSYRWFMAGFAGSMILLGLLTWITIHKIKTIIKKDNSIFKQY